MAARPRTHNINVPNLYRKIDKRTGKVNYQYFNKLTGKWKSKTINDPNEEKEVIHAAIEANRVIAEKLTEHYNHFLDTKPQKIKQHGINADSFCEKYISIQTERYEHNEISQSTLKAKILYTNRFAERFKGVGLKDIDTRSIALIIDEYKNEGKFRAAQLLRSYWVDIFNEAQHQGEVDSGFNPAKSTRAPRVKIQRSRLSKSDFMLILDSAIESGTSYIVTSMLLAITTGLRREDITNLKFTDIKDEHLFVVTSKSRGKTKLAFPLDLRNDLIGMTLREVISKCRATGVLSKYVLHHASKHNRAIVGQKVDGKLISKWFAKCRDNTSLKWEDSTPPSFHEIRSLAERQYHSQGLDTQILLGHKNRAMTDRYHDNRGSEYTFIELSKKA